ncbi:ABC transporter permease, partial [Planctomycetota bacterium]
MLGEAMFTKGFGKTGEKNVLTCIDKILQKYGLMLAFIVICTILSLLSPAFMKTQNIINVLRQISINGVLAIGVTYVILTGGIDLSLGSLVAITGVLTATFAHPQTYPLIVGLLKKPLYFLNLSCQST